MRKQAAALRLPLALIALLLLSPGWHPGDFMLSLPSAASSFMPSVVAFQRLHHQPGSAAGVSIGLAAAESQCGEAGGSGEPMQANPWSDSSSTQWVDSSTMAGSEWKPMPIIGKLSGRQPESTGPDGGHAALGSVEVCRPGYRLAGKCVDLDECAWGRHNCSKSQVCANIEGSFFCAECLPEHGTRDPADQQLLASFAKNRLQSSVFSKKSLSQECRLNEGSNVFRLHCRQGYRKVEQEGGFMHCLDIDECKEESDTCGEHKCLNTDGSYECKCKFGWFPSRQKCELAKLTVSDRNEFGNAVGVSDDGLTVLVGAYHDDDRGSNAGSAYVYKMGPGGMAVQTAKLTAPDGGSSDYFGRSVSLSGDGSTAVIGAPQHGSSSGGAYVYKIGSDGSAVHAAKLSSPSCASAHFGQSVSVSRNGGVAVVGAHQDYSRASRSGSAFVFKIGSDGSAVQTAKLAADDGSSSDYLGYAVGVSGDGTTALVGAYGDDDRGGSSGSAYVYKIAVNGSATQTAKLTASDGASSDLFGCAVSVSEDGSTALVGAQGQCMQSGSAYVYKIAVNGSATQRAKLTASDGSSSDYFGWSVSLSGDGSRAIVGAYQDDYTGSNSGSAYAFRLADDGGVTLAGKLSAAVGGPSQQFGSAVSASANGSVALIGAELGTGNTLYTGAAYVAALFAGCSAGYHQMVNGSCVDIDECLHLGAHACGSDHCVNVPGSYICVACLPSGSTLVDMPYVNDVVSSASDSLAALNSSVPLASLTSAANASNHEVCGWTAHPSALGALRIHCQAGFMRSQETGECEDIDECLEVDACPLFATCNNTQGSYSCLTNAMARLTATDGGWSDYFGHSVSLSDDGQTALVGAYQDDDRGSNAGSAYVYKMGPGGMAVQTAKLTAPDGGSSDYFGRSVSLSGDGSTAVIGAYANDHRSYHAGSAYVFKIGSDGSAVQTAKLTADDGSSSDYLGYAVGVSGDGTTALVGAYYDDDRSSNSGSAYVYKIAVNGSATQTAKLTASDGASSDLFGCSVSVSGDGSTALIGAYGDDDRGSNSGSAYVYRIAASGSAIQIAKLTASDGSFLDSFGLALSISGDGRTAVIGAPGHADPCSNTGSAYVFQISSDGLTMQTAKLTAADPISSLDFGGAVGLSVDGKTAIVGAKQDHVRFSNSGSAYVFRIAGNGAAAMLPKLTSMDGASGDFFGQSVSVSADGTVALIGAHMNDHKTSNAGSAYMFSLTFDDGL